MTGRWPYRNPLDCAESLYDLPTGEGVWESAVDGSRGLEVGAHGGVAYAITGAQRWGGEAFPTRFEVFDLNTGQRLWRLSRGISRVAWAGDRLLLHHNDGRSTQSPAARLLLMPSRPSRLP